MSLSPQAIRNKELPRAGFGGYKREDVDKLLEEIADALAATSRERDDLSERLTRLTAESEQKQELEALLRATLVSAERAAQDMKEQARRESDLIVQEAHAEARQITRASLAEKQRIEGETRQIRAILRSALEVLEDGSVSKQGEEQPAVQHVSAPAAKEGGIRTIAG